MSDGGTASAQPFDLAELLTREHRDIDGGIERFVANSRSAADGTTDPTPLLHAMEALRRHIYLEEEFIFPSLLHGALAIPVQVMLREHGEIWRAMDRLESRLASADASTEELRADCQELLGILDTHNTKEEPIIYPRAQPALDVDSQDELAEFMTSGRMPEGWVCRTAAL